MYSSCVFGSVSDSEFPILFKEVILLSGSILVDFNYLCQESTFTLQNGKLLEIQDLTSLKYYIQKINPPEPWNRNEPNIICFSKSPISGNTLGLLQDMGYSLEKILFKVGYSFTYFGINLLLVKVVTRQDSVLEIVGNQWLIIVKSPEYSNSNDAQKYTSTLKNITALLKPIVGDLGSVDHTFLRLQYLVFSAQTTSSEHLVTDKNRQEQMARFGDFTQEKSSPKKNIVSKEIVIPRRNLEISDEAWDKTIQKAASMSTVQENSIAPLKTKDPVINKEIVQYLQELALKNQELLCNTQKTIDLFQEKLKMQAQEEAARKLKDKELKDKELKDKELKDKEQAQKVSLKTEKVASIKEKEPGKQNDLHSIPGRVVSVSAYQDSQSCIEVITNAKKLKHSLNSPSIFKGKMTIRTRCGQFINLQSKAKNISSLLEEGKKESEQVYQYLMYLVAKQVIKQAETEVAVKKDLAFPIAVFCCMLMEKHLAFKDYLIGKMITKCPYIVPMYVKKGQNTDAEYRKRLGYKKKDDGSYETEIQYEERMCGVLSLYAAIVQTTALPHSYGIQYGWKWLSRILNLPARRISASLILTFIELAGYEMYKKYPTQMPKLMKLLSIEIIPKMPEAAVASITRLQLFLGETAVKSGTIPEPFGKYLKKK